MSVLGYVWLPFLKTVFYYEKQVSYVILFQKTWKNIF